MANSRRGPPPEPPEPELRMSRSEADTALEKQIEEGRRLLEWPGASDGDYQSLDHEHSAWTGFNSELLGRMFTTNYYKALYGRQWGYSSTINPTFRDRERLLKDNFISDQISRLNTIRRRPLIPDHGDPGKPEAAKPRAQPLGLAPHNASPAAAVVRPSGLGACGRRS